jgi:hypothetical protein
VVAAPPAQRLAVGTSHACQGYTESLYVSMVWSWQQEAEMVLCTTVPVHCCQHELASGDITRQHVHLGGGARCVRQECKRASLGIQHVSVPFAPVSTIDLESTLRNMNISCFCISVSALSQPD